MSSRAGAPRLGREEVGCRAAPIGQVEGSFDVRVRCANARPLGGHFFRVSGSLEIVEAACRTVGRVVSQSLESRHRRLGVCPWISIAGNR